MERLMSLRNASFQRVDDETAKANDLVETICRKYEVPNRYELLVERRGKVSFDGLLLDPTTLLPKGSLKDLDSVGGGD
jgi:hypothetical protein